MVWALPAQDRPSQRKTAKPKKQAAEESQAGKRPDQILAPNETLALGMRIRRNVSPRMIPYR